MHDLCSDILEQVTNMPLSLYAIGIGVNLTSIPATGELSCVRAIQLRTQDQNLVFQVWAVVFNVDLSSFNSFFLL
jgi:hypothetical protein